PDIASPGQGAADLPPTGPVPPGATADGTETASPTTGPEQESFLSTFLDQVFNQQDAWQAPLPGSDGFPLPDAPAAGDGSGAASDPAGTMPEGVPPFPGPDDVPVVEDGTDPA